MIQAQAISSIPATATRSVLGLLRCRCSDRVRAVSHRGVEKKSGGGPGGAADDRADGDTRRLLRLVVVLDILVL